MGMKCVVCLGTYYNNNIILMTNEYNEYNEYLSFKSKQSAVF